MTQQPLDDKGLLIVVASRSHSDTPHSVGLLWASDQPDAETSTSQYTQLSKGTNIHVAGGIRTHIPSKRAVADPRLRPCGHWDRHTVPIKHAYPYKYHLLAEPPSNCAKDAYNEARSARVT